ncbi:unnamed protein product [Schistosoma mattheei]|uniref:Uncharacterized protein n=1 Tax=Schistosoma mattheei TaxID=31246 RepID=A0A183PJY1_9TREM|nr:unnamed protein product [Schistosoma mattheei]
MFTNSKTFPCGLYSYSRTTLPRYKLKKKTCTPPTLNHAR